MEGPERAVEQRHPSDFGVGDVVELEQVGATDAGVLLPALRAPPVVPMAGGVAVSRGGATLGNMSGLMGQLHTLRRR